jgi:hypothetical protein
MITGARPGLRHPRGAFWALAFATAWSCALGAGCSKRKPADAPELEQRVPYAQLAFTTGEVSLLEADGSTRPAKPGPLPPGGRLITRPGARAVLTTADGVRVEVGPDGQLEWQTDGDRFVVVPGRAVVVSQPPADNRRRLFTLAIKTPNGMMHVPAEGAEAAFDVGSTRTRIEMRFGHVVFFSNKKRKIELRVGDRIDLSIAGIEIVRSDGSRQTLGDDGEEAHIQGKPEAPAATTAEAKAAPPPVPAPAPTPAPAEKDEPAADNPYGGRPTADDSTPLPAPQRAALVLPMAIDLRVFGDAPGEVTLTWPTSPPIARLEVARDHRFRQVVMAGVPTGEHVNLAPPRTGSLYWRVLDEHAQELKRGKAKFYRDSPSDAGGGGRAVVSDIGGAAKLFYQRVVPVTFTFTSHPRAASYRLRVTAVGEGQKPVFNAKVREAQHTLKAGVLRDGQYVWSATPLDASGAPLGDARENRLTINYDNATVDLTVNKPRRGERVRGREVQVKGVAPLESKLFVNGQRAPLDAKGRFDFRVARSPALIFRLVTSEGETFWVRGLRTGT